MWTPAGGFWGSSGAPGADNAKNTFVGALIFASAGLTLASFGSGLQVRPTPAKYPTMVEPAHDHGHDDGEHH